MGWIRSFRTNLIGAAVLEPTSLESYSNDATDKLKQPKIASIILVLPTNLQRQALNNFLKLYYYYGV